MPTHDEDARFLADFARLSLAERRAFLAAVAKFVADLRTGRFRKGLRVKRLQGHEGLWEMTWADDGRAIFEYGPAVMPGHHHVLWRRVGSHDILENP